MEILYTIIAACIAVLVLFRTWRFVNWAFIRPRRIEKILRKQGLKGNAYKPLIGDYLEMSSTREEVKTKSINIDDDIKPRAMPFIFKTIQKYGANSFFWQGPKASVIITEAAQIKEVATKLKVYHKQEILNPLAKLFAPGVVSLEEDKWSKHRQIVNPAFHQDKLKLMVPAIRESCEQVLNKLEELIVSPKGYVELDVWPYLKNMTCDAISRTAFGSNYLEGRRIFELQQEQSELVLKSLESLYIPGLRFLPTHRNKRMRQIEEEVRPMIGGLINKRIEESKAGKAINKDLLGLMVECNIHEIQQGGHKSYGLTYDEIVEESKVFFFGGQDTTSTLLASTLFLLSTSPDWQQKARDEVLAVFGNKKPNSEGLNHLKILTMILQEVLRLYPPIVALDRHCMDDTKLGKLTLPAGVHIVIPVILLHHSREIWGEDALKFNPQRFSEGMAKAPRGSAASEGLYFPFGWGPRTCLGQNFAFLEAKVILSMILQRFSFELSPSYIHAPHTILTLQPQHGVQLLLHSL